MSDQPPPSDADAADDEPEAAAPADDVAPLTRDDLGPGESILDRLTIGPLVLGAVALLLVGFIVGRVTADDDGTAEAVTTTAVPPVTFPSGDQDRSGYWGFGGVTPVAADAFQGEPGTDGLGAADSGGQWTTVSGEWRVEGGQAAAAPAAPETPSITVLDGGPAERLTEVTASVVEDGAGIVFRYRNPENYWSMTGTPGSGIWTVTRVVEGESVVAAEVPGQTADGTTITVAQRGPELQILIEGVEAIRVTDPALQQERKSGLITAAGSDGSARFDRFYVGAMPGS